MDIGSRSSSYITTLNTYDTQIAILAFSRLIKKERDEHTLFLIWILDDNPTQKLHGVFAQQTYKKRDLSL